MKSIKRGLDISEELQQHVINGKSFFYRILGGFLHCKDFHEGTCL